AIRSSRSHGGSFLRAGLPASQEYPRLDGDSCFDGDHVASVFHLKEARYFNQEEHSFMDASGVVQKIGETLGATASVKSVFGEPIHAAGRTIVPVARVAYGFGGGFGQGERARGENAPHGEGGGGGGAVRAYPAGALEITESGTRFIAFHDLRWIVGTFAFGAA